MVIIAAVPRNIPALHKQSGKSETGNVPNVAIAAIEEN